MNFYLKPKKKKTSPAKTGAVITHQVYALLEHRRMVNKTLFKVSYVKTLDRRNFSKRTVKLLGIMERDGMKCKCCNEGELFFRIHKVPQSNSIFFEPVLRKIKDGKVRLTRMTSDHDMLDSLNGGNEEANLSALCIECNSLRANRFAQFAEFKHWYDSTEDKTVVPPTNFCYIDFKKNIQDSHIARNMQDIPCVPEAVKEQLTERFADGIIDLEYIIDYGTTNFNNVVMNKLLNELIQVYLRKHVGITKARLPTYNLTDLQRVSLSVYRKNQMKLLKHCIRHEIEINSSRIQKLKNAINYFFRG